MLLVIYASQPVFIVVVLAASLLGMTEFFKMALPKERGLERTIAFVFGTLFGLQICWQKPHNAILVFCLTFLLLAIVHLLRFNDLERVIQQLALTLFGIIYLPFLLSHLVLLRSLESGREWVFLALVIAMAGDSAAYFVGSAFGKRKLYPAISPNKSIEGGAGGLAGSVIGAFLFKMIALPQIENWVVLLMAVVLAVLGQLGDLFESMLKRSFKVKDSGSMIPGHGGILDRLDSLLFVFPATYYLIFFLG